MTSQSEDKPNPTLSLGAKDYRWIGRHAQDFSLAGGRVFMAGPGDVVPMTKDDLEMYKDLVDSGLLLESTSSGGNK